MIEEREFNLDGRFVLELFAILFVEEEKFDELISKIEYQHMDSSATKNILGYIQKTYNKTGQKPSLATAIQHYQNDLKTKYVDVLKILEKVGIIIDNGVNREEVLTNLDVFLNKQAVLDCATVVVEKIKEHKFDEAKQVVKDFAEKEEFTSKEDNYIDFCRETVEEWEKEEVEKEVESIPTGITPLDNELGGISRSEICLWLGASGSGKSLALIHIGRTAALAGKAVIHFTLEGKDNQCRDRYISAFSGTPYSQVVREHTILSRKWLEKISNIRIHDWVDGDFRHMTDIRKACKKYLSDVGQLDVIIVDYLDIVGDIDEEMFKKDRGERFRQIALSKAMKSLSQEFNCVVHTATQSNLPDYSNVKNAEAFVHTSANLSEAKGKIRAVDYLITINQTKEEKQKQILRLYTDKVRSGKSGEVYKIAVDYALCRFFDEIGYKKLQEEAEEPVLNYENFISSINRE